MYDAVILLVMNGSDTAPARIYVLKHEKMPFTGEIDPE